MTEAKPAILPSVRNCRDCHKLFRYRPGGPDLCSNCRPDADGTAEALISKINEGHTATVLMQWLEPILSEVEATALREMKSAYRGGKPSQDFLSQLAVVDEIRIRIKQRISEGTQAARDIHPNEEIDGD